MKQLLQRMLRTCGKEIRGVDAPTRSYERGLRSLKRFISPQTVIDVGAAAGTPDLYSVFSFDDFDYLLLEAHPVFEMYLKEVQNHARVKIARVFCGAANGNIVLHGYDNPYNSSSLELMREDGGEGQKIVVEQRRLDDVVDEYGLSGSYLLKIDVEGAEYDVLSGALDVLRDTQAVVCEIALMERYKSGKQFADVIRLLDDAGFALYDILAGSNQLSTGRMYQADFVFVKKDASFRHVRYQL